MNAFSDDQLYGFNTIHKNEYSIAQDKTETSRGRLNHGGSMSTRRMSCFDDF